MLKYSFVFQAQFTEKKSVEKYSIPSCFQILSEIGEATSAILDNKVRYAPVLQYFMIFEPHPLDILSFMSENGRKSGK